MIDDPFPLSPVPGDADLEPGKLPFTAFGQYGEGAMDLRVFEQGIYWVDNHGEPFRIDQMERLHLLRVLRMLRDNAEFFHAHAHRAAMVDLDDALLFGDLARTQKLERQLADDVLDVSPDDWLRATVLARALFDRLRSLPVQG